MQEIAAQKLYLRMAEQTSYDDLKKLFQRLVAEESEHEKLIGSYDIEKLKLSNRSGLKKLDLVSDMDKNRMFAEDVKEVNDALDFAIKEEQKQHDQYSFMIKHLNFGDSREAFEELARQEINHKNELLKVKLEFNKNDWKSLRIN